MPKATAQTLDALTGLPKRSAFEQRLDQAVREAQRTHAAVSIAVIDVDYMGRLNTELGREAADQFLTALAQRAKALGGQDGACYRFGGDALGMLWEGMEKEQAFLKAETLRRELLQGQGRQEAAPGTLSIGVAAFPDDGNDAATIVQRAPEALYRAKVSGRNRVCLAREEKMVTKTSHYFQGQLLGLRRLAEREGIGEAVLLREALNDLLRKYNA